jgi:hypothetical protein
VRRHAVLGVVVHGLVRIWISIGPPAVDQSRTTVCSDW